MTCISKETIDREDLDTFVPAILQILSLLEFQLFLYDSVIDWNNDWSTLLSSSNVRSLRIIGSRLTLTRSLDDSHPCNEQLSTLAIRTKEPLSLHIVPLLKNFPNLKDLCLSHVNNGMLESICSNQVKERPNIQWLIIFNGCPSY